MAIRDDVYQFYRSPVGLESIYGTAFSSAMRRDLAAKYAAAIAQEAKLGEDGMTIMIANGWFEQPPHTVNRKELVKK